MSMCYVMVREKLFILMSLWTSSVCCYLSLLKMLKSTRSWPCTNVKLNTTYIFYILQSYILQN